MAKKQIRQVDIDTGEEIEVYDSILEAAEDNYIDRERLSVALRKKGGVIKTLELKFEYV